MTIETFLGRRRTEYDPAVRGDPITGERYHSPAWMQAEWDRLWTRIWHIGAMAQELEEEGDWVRHDFMKESVVIVRQADGGFKAFYNACRHRGNRLALHDSGGGTALTCSYHGWRWGIDGVLLSAQDADDVVGGNPCGKAKLVELPCAVWGGMIWYSFDPDVEPLERWLAPLPDEVRGYGLEDWVRVVDVRVDTPCNWKVIRDNFNESYHLPTLHPELDSFINDDYRDTIFEMYPNGHNRMVMKGGQPSARDAALAAGVKGPLDAILKGWDLDPDSFAGNASAARTALAAAKARLGPERGFTHYAGLDASQLTDYYHYTLFPNVTLTISADGYQMLRTEPHPTDPERCIFDHWFIMPQVAGMDMVETPIGRLPFAQAARDQFAHGERTTGAVADQDLSVAVSQQQGLHSRGYTGGLLTGQEKRIQRFHELLNDRIGL
ncbi:MAG TPA: aromatic ring-hydroxylating dioxygenase subunit alpha [Sphingomonas sp.]|jgi:phenylpropionate dioxygenase-like ring-hydroxylating dioxygenase large terminal subunit|uniref:aromatic ring-hydroxylating oxygenase subunit alpha n=1 Tax=Sphingomonas sp. TaxID=28214 RepID=UPI002ED859CD